MSYLCPCGHSSADIASYLLHAHTNCGENNGGVEE